jgi:hypothetical protein
MKSIKEAKQVIGSVLGPEALEKFEEFLDDFTYYVRSLSMIDLKTPEEVIRYKLKIMCKGLIVESVKVFLKSKYNSGSGTIRVNVTDDGIYDQHMRPLPEIAEIKTKQADVVECILDEAMHEFEKGRELALQVVERAKSFEANRTDEVVYEPPTEEIEIEVLRLERKLPNITEEEGKKLSEYYDILRTR